MSSAPLPTALALAALPALGAPLAGGTFAGVITQKDGQHVAVVLLPAQAEDVAWQAAMDWATEQGGQLPTRPMAALLFANVKPQLRERWHWTNETLDLGDDDDDDASCAWICDFYYGGQSYDHKSYEGCAVAVRCIPLSA
tara:strand:+ start:166 stop:585 length:420 start_codon:yes stop_codon:yes gene_type:complete